MDKTINLFVSHSGSDETRIDDFKNLMGNAGYSFHDSSIRESDPNKAKSEEYIKSGILAPAIKWAGTMIVLIGNDTHKSDWVNWEIEYAAKNEKKIIGVFLPGERDAELPDALKKFGDGCVGWNKEKIKEALESDVSKWEDNEGNTFYPNEMTHITC